MWQKNLADSLVKSDVTSGSTSLQSFRNFNNYFPPNLAGTKLAASKGVVLVLYTNSPSMGVYQSLTPGENAQLLLNVCNANLSETYNTICVFAGVGKGAGAKIHVKGTVTSNTQWRSPIYQQDVVLPASHESIALGIVEQFLAQGGTFPVIVSGNNTALPEPTKVPNGPATRYCLEGRSANYQGLIYHTVDNNTNVLSGACPNDPELHYFP